MRAEIIQKHLSYLKRCLKQAIFGLNTRTEPYEIGTGYGHIAYHVDDLDGTLARLDAIGVQPEKPPYSIREGGSRLCFVRDPDGYRIELIEKVAGD